MRTLSRRRKHGRRRAELGEFCDRCKKLKGEFGYLLDLHEHSFSVTLPLFGKLTARGKPLVKFGGFGGNSVGKKSWIVSAVKGVLYKTPKLFQEFVRVHYGNPCKSCAASESDSSDLTRS